MTQPTPIWSVRASVVDDRSYGPLGLERRRGSKHFRAGAKVWVIDGFWGMGGDMVTVVGRHRASVRYIRIVVPTHHLNGFRPDLVYSPTAVALIREHASGSCVLSDRAAAETLAGHLSTIATEKREKPPGARLFRVMGQRDAQTMRLRQLLFDDELGPTVDVPLEMMSEPMRQIGATVLWSRSDDGPNRLQLVAPGDGDADEVG